MAEAEVGWGWNGENPSYYGLNFVKLCKTTYYFEWHWSHFFLNKIGRVMIIRLSNGQNPYYCSPHFDLKPWATLTPKPWVEVKNYFCEIRRDLTGNNCTRSNFRQTKKWPWQSFVYSFSGGSKGVASGTSPLLRPKMFSISCSFSENLAKSYVGAPSLKGWRPLLQGILDLPLSFGHYSMSMTT